MDQKLKNKVANLNDVAELLKSSFVAKDELVELLVTCAIAQEHLLVVGPPGTAKSALVKRFAQYCSGSEQGQAEGRVSYFEYLLTRFTEPNEIFGAVDVKAFAEGKGGQRYTQGMLPQAEMAFLDEIFKANSAILNALLTVLNERRFYHGPKRDNVPLIMVVGATNSVPDDSSLAALYDRFLLRVWTDNVEEQYFPDLFRRGWELERSRIVAGYGVEEGHLITTDLLRELYQEVERVDLSAIEQPYRQVIRRIRAEGIKLSDRRVIKLLKLIAASALRDGRLVANTGDFWLLRYIWNEPEQMAHLKAIIDPYVQAHDGERWQSERSLTAMEEELKVLEIRLQTLRTDTDFLDFLQQLGSLRRELERHSTASDKAPAEEQKQQSKLLTKTNTIIDNVMEMMEMTL